MFYLFFDNIVNDKLFLTPDFISAYSEQKPLREYHKETGQLPFWNPYSFSGMPSYESLTYNPFTSLIPARGSIVGLLGFFVVIGLASSMYRGEVNLFYVISLSIYSILHLFSYVHNMETLLIVMAGGTTALLVGWFACELETKYGWADDRNRRKHSNSGNNNDFYTSVDTVLLLDENKG